jgi:hypothetical protein
MFVVPVATPVSIPELITIVALDVLLLIHVPPVVAFEKRAVDPTQTLPGPVMDEGAGVTVTTAIREQPVLNV